jgi:hypothetical protein
MIYGHPTYTNRIYEARDRINDAYAGSILDSKKGYMLSTKHLLVQVVKEVNRVLAKNGDKLTKHEEDEIFKILGSDDFKAFAKSEMQTFIQDGEMKNVNTLQFILDLFFEICLINVNLELATKGKVPAAQLRKMLTKTRIVPKDEMKSFVNLFTKVSSGLVLKLLAMHPLFLEYALNISNMVKSKK